MKLSSKDQASPLISEHGEVVYELIGRAVGQPTESHSLAHVKIPPGKASLPHHHPLAEESYYILAGRGRMVLGDEETVVVPGQAVVIPPTQMHQVFNIGDTDLELLAICVPAWEPTNSVYMA
jgi:mannose-6-phosphate isomerase-like protein (cupin superfamily)